MIKIVLNKKEIEVEENLTPAKLIKQHGYHSAAFWINGEQLPKSEYASRVFKDGEDIKMRPIIAGG